MIGGCDKKKTYAKKLLLLQQFHDSNGDTSFAGCE